MLKIEAIHGIVMGGIRLIPGVEGKKEAALNDFIWQLLILIDVFTEGTFDLIDRGPEED